MLITGYYWSSTVCSCLTSVNGEKPPGSDGLMATALKRYNGGRVLVFVVGAFAEMSGDVSRICDITHTTLRGPTSHTTTTIPSAPRACTNSASRRPGGTLRLGPPPPRSRSGPHHPRPGAPRRQRRGDADGRGRLGRPLLLKPPREGGYSAA